MYNMIQNGNFTDGFLGWKVQGFPHNIPRMNTTRGSLTQIPVSGSISQLIPVQENSSYVFQFKINPILRGVFRILVKEGITHREETILTECVYEFDHHSSQQQILTTTSHANRFEITIENTGHSPLTIQSIELIPASHSFSEIYYQQSSKPFQEGCKNPTMNLISSRFSYLDLSEVNGLSFSQLIDQERTIGERLIQYIPKDPLQHLLRWMNPNGAIQVVPTKHDSSDVVVSFHESLKRIIIQIKYKNDLDTIEFIENILYGLGLALDVYAGNRASDHPEFQQLIQQEKERYREITGYVFTGDYSDIFSQIFTSLYSPYEENKKNILQAAPQTSHYIKALFELLGDITRFKGHNSNIQNIDNIRIKKHVSEEAVSNSLFNTLYMSRGSRIEKPIDFIDVEDNELRTYHEEQYKNLEKTLSSKQKAFLRQLEVQDLDSVNAILQNSNGKDQPSYTKDLDDILDSKAATVKNTQYIYINATKKFGLSYGDTDFNTLKFMKPDSYLVGTLKPMDLSPQDILMQIAIPKDASLGFLSDGETLFTNADITLSLDKQVQIEIGGRNHTMLYGSLVPSETIDLTQYQKNAEASSNEMYKNALQDSANPTAIFVGTSDVKGPYGSLILAENPQKTTTVDRFTSRVLSNMMGMPNVLGVLFDQMDPGNKGIFRFSTANRSYWDLSYQTFQNPGGVFDLEKGYIQMDFSNAASITLKEELEYAHYGLELFARALDTMMLRYVDSNADINQPFITPSLAESSEFIEIFKQESSKFQRKFYNNTTPSTPEEFFVAVFAELFTVNKDPNNPLDATPLAKEFIINKLKKAGSIIDALKDPDGFDNLLRDYGTTWLNEKNEITDLYFSGKLEEALQQLTKNIDENNGDISHLYNDYIRLQTLNEMFTKLKPIPHPIEVLVEKEPIEENLGKPVDLEQLKNDPNVIGKLNVLLENAIMYGVPQIGKNIKEVIPSGAKIMSVGDPNNKIRRKLLVKLPKVNSIKDQTRQVFTSLKGVTKAILLDEAQVVGKIDRLQSTLNEKYKELNIISKENIWRSAKYGKIINMESLMVTKGAACYAMLNDIQQMMETFIDKSNIPKGALRLMMQQMKGTEKGSVRIIEEIVPSSVIKPFKSKYNISEDSIDIEMIRKSQIVGGVALRDFTSDAIFAGGFKMYYKYYEPNASGFNFKGSDLDEMFRKLSPYDFQMSMLSGMGVEINPTDFGQPGRNNHSIYFGMMVAYLYGPDVKKQEAIQKTFPAYCDKIKQILEKMKPA
ncbi:hypothetical protein [Bacillus cereus]|uniref:hypothetical protein n=1 Tax=Bacillus cereus TaxID=1396 RepID=UPI00404124FA